MSAEPSEPTDTAPDTVKILGFTYATGPKVKTVHLVALAITDWIMRLVLGREEPAPPPALEGEVLAIAKVDLLGDVLMITPLLRELRQQAPSTKLLLIVGSWSVEAGRLILDEGLCDSLLIYDPPTMSPARVSWFQKFRRWLRTLRRARTELLAQKAGIYLDLRSSSPNSLLLARLAGIRHKIGFAVRGYSYVLQQTLPYRSATPMGQQYLDALTTLGLASAPYEKPVLAWRGSPEPLPTSLSPHPDYLILHPFSRNPRKMIAAAWWEQMLARLGTARRIVALGTRGDLENHALVAVLTSAGCDLSAVGRTTFRQAIACVREAVAFVGVDSVFAHVALACDKPAYVAAIKGASFRPAFPKANAHLFYDEVSIAPGSVDFPSPAFEHYCQRISPDALAHRQEPQ